MKKYGLLGKSLKHSFSPAFFKNYFEEAGIEASYEVIELQNLENARQELADFDGFNVTIPYKEAIIPFLDEIDSEASAIGAVNVVCKKDNRWVGFNSDAFGFQQSIKPFLTNQHERALILGTGGGSKAVAHVLKQIGVDCIFISRHPSGSDQFGFNEINEHMIRACKLIVNTTPIGMFPHAEEQIDLPYEFLTEDHLLVDLIYNPEVTRFLEAGKKHHAAILNGSSMLKEQAIRSYQLWTAHV